VSDTGFDAIDALAQDFTGWATFPPRDLLPETEPLSQPAGRLGCGAISAGSGRPKTGRSAERFERDPQGRESL